MRWRSPALGPSFHYEVDAEAQSKELLLSWGPGEKLSTSRKATQLCFPQGLGCRCVTQWKPCWLFKSFLPSPKPLSGGTFG